MIQIQQKKTARIAGLCFLAMVVFGLYAELIVREKLIAPQDIAATAGGILSNVFLYRTGILSDLLMSLFYLLTALALYKLLAPVDKSTASLMVVFAAAGSVLLLFNILFEAAPLYILSGGAYQNNADAGRLAMLFYDLYGHGYMIGQIFFALWVLPLGVLIYKSGFIPKVFGILFVLETIFGLLSAFVHFLVPDGTAETLLLLPGTVAEITFLFWLLICGVRYKAAAGDRLREVSA